MSPSRFRLPLVTVVALSVLSTTALSLAACEVTTAPAPQTNSADAASAKVRLDELVVAAEHTMANYSRDRFPHWSAQGGGCDTRDVVLKRDGTNVVATTDCKITSGSWFSQYDEKTFSDPKLLDVDHMVPLAAAWRSGADSWDDAQRSLFANDLVRPQLIAVSASSNRSKGDQDPSKWRPTNRAFWCQYAQRWVAVKRYWQLTVTEKEKSKLVEMLETCTWPSGAALISPTTPAA